MIDQRPLASVIIPVLQDSEALTRVLESLPPDSSVEVIVTNGGARDRELVALESARPDVKWILSSAGRGRQMNAGALHANGRWLVFLHADTRLPAGWRRELEEIDPDASVVGGSFRLGLDSSSRWARVIEGGVRWRTRWLGLPYGDQALFARHGVFGTLGGFRDLALMEDVDFVQRLRRKGRLHHSPLAVVTSARRWEADGWCRRSLKNLALVTLFFAGVSPDWLGRRYASRAARMHGARADA